jgi:hypothetical protein
MEDLIEFLIAVIAVAFMLVAPWAIALGMDSICPGLGAMSLVVTIPGCPVLAICIADIVGDMIATE